jgi:SAM-dependent methyltransferase
VHVRGRGWALTGDPYAHLARGYDLTARTYDDVEGANRLSERARRLVRETAMSVFRPGDRILELGCGTGRDAVFLARHGMRVVATDVSPAMIAVTQDRAARAGLLDRITAQVAAASVASEMAEAFDGVYSNGAVLNLEPDLPRTARGLARRVRVGGHAVLAVANRLSLFELLVYPLLLRPRKAFRKLGDSVPIPISRADPGKRYVVPTRFLTPGEFVDPFLPAFEVVARRGLQAITPPWNLVDEASRFPAALEALEQIEDRLGAWPAMRDVGAISIVVLRRRHPA